MCLEIISERMIAEEDIVCYKLVLKNDKVYPSDLSNSHGKPFFGVICGISCTGKISIQDRVVYLCTNDPMLINGTVDDKLGYFFSWRLNGSVSGLTVEGIQYPLPGNLYRTFYQKAIIEIGKTYISKLIVEDFDINIGLHSYKHIIDILPPLLEHIYIVRCIIPKGSEYYEGIHGDNESFASNQLTYLKIINDNIS